MMPHHSVGCRKFVRTEGIKHCPSGGAVVYHRPKANFSFQFIASYVWYSMEKLAGDLLLGSKANFSFQFMASYVWYSMEKLAGDLVWVKIC